MGRRFVIERLSEGAVPPAGEGTRKVDAPNVAAIRLVFGVGSGPDAQPTEDTFKPVYSVSIPVFSLGGLDPDGNGNGKGLRARTASNHWNYISGQIMDAIVASGTPAATASTGSADVLGRRYDDIVQDMIDQYAWGATDNGPTGGWDYTSFNNTGGGGSNDSSASHWWAIGTIASRASSR